MMYICDTTPRWVKDVSGNTLIYTVYPKKYAHGFAVLCFVVVMQSFIMNAHEVFIHIHQGCFAGTGAIVRLPQCQWSKPDGYGKISQCITTTKHSKAKTVCIFLGIYCRLDFNTRSSKRFYDNSSAILNEVNHTKRIEFVNIKTQFETFISEHVINIVPTDGLVLLSARSSVATLITKIEFRVSYSVSERTRVRVNREKESEKEKKVERDTKEGGGAYKKNIEKCGFFLNGDKARIWCSLLYSNSLNSDSNTTDSTKYSRCLIGWFV